MEANIYNKDGKVVGQVKLPDAIFGLKWNADMVAQVVHSMMSNKRQGNADTKGRGEVRGGGKKPWKQKGTGRARHGSIRSPIWVGGGVTHGPLSEKNYSRKINRKMKNKALFTALSAKLKDNEIIFVDSFEMSAPKTKEAEGSLKSLSKVSGFDKISFKKGNRALIVTPDKNENMMKSFGNLKATKVWEARDLSPLDVLNYKYLVITNPEKSLAVLSGRKG